MMQIEKVTMPVFKVGDITFHSEDAAVSYLVNQEIGEDIKSFCDIQQYKPSARSKIATALVDFAAWNKRGKPMPGPQPADAVNDKTDAESKIDSQAASNGKKAKAV